MNKYIFPRVAELTPEQMRKALDDIAAILWVENRPDLPSDWRNEPDSKVNNFWLYRDKEVNGADFIDAVTGVLREVDIKPPEEEKYIGHELP